MPRTDVPPPGQGKRSQRKAWRDNADRTIAIYSLTAEETMETKAIEDTELIPWSHELPYWDDAPQPQPQSRSLNYTEEEVQELVDKAYQEGWQQGLEEGYKLGKEKGVKEYKVQVQEEEEVKKAKTRANEATTTRQDVCGTSRSLKTNPSAHFGTSTVEIVEIDHQAAPGDARHSISTTTATSDPHSLTAAPRSAQSSIPPISSSTNAQNIEIENTAAYNTSTSSNTSQTAQLHTENTTNDIYDPYIVVSDPQIAPSNNNNNPEVHHPINTSTSKYTIPDAQTDETTVFLVDYGVQSLTPAPRTSPDAADPSKTPYTPMPHHYLPPLPSLQPLTPSPYKRANTQSETSTILTKAHDGPTSPIKTTSAQFRSNIYSNSSNTALPPSERSPTTVSNPSIIDSVLPQLSAAPTIIIHAQTVVIGGPPTYTQKSVQNTLDDECAVSPKRNAGNSEDVHRAPATPPRDLSVLCSYHCRPFSSLRRRSRRRRSMPVRDFNWDSNQHYRDFSRAPQAQGWAPPTR